MKITKEKANNLFWYIGSPLSVVLLYLFSRVTSSMFFNDIKIAYFLFPIMAPIIININMIISVIKKKKPLYLVKVFGYLPIFIYSFKILVGYLSNIGTEETYIENFFAYSAWILLFFESMIMYYIDYLKHR